MISFFTFPGGIGRSDDVTGLSNVSEEFGCHVARLATNHQQQTSGNWASAVANKPKFRIKVSMFAPSGQKTDAAQKAQKFGQRNCSLG